MTTIAKQTALEKILKLNKSIPEFRNESNKEFKERLKGKRKLILTAILNRKPAGYLIGYAINKSAFYIWMAGVIPKYRRKKVMTALMDYTERWTKEKGYKKIKIKTRSTRKAQLANLLKRKYTLIRTETVQKEGTKKYYFEKKLL
ncbi:Acetyltransferase (GNAT) family protein [uncultured archaeon]|nr:Acetyltransferase (GNAT) family protein [uncultured archaeon]